MTSIRALLALLALFASGGAAAQTTYKCVQDGKTMYQATPCPAEAKQDTLKKGTTQATTALNADIDRTIDFTATYRADGVQVWGQEMAEPYAQWRTRNAKMVSRIESDGQLQAKYKAGVEARRNGKAGMCRDVALELRGKK
jgi:hypothetical protein